ncbi:MAG: arylsulfatase [Opitutaceae bacterium]|nr:arylsulfatase [Opitutaceae bacterium]
MKSFVALTAFLLAATSLALAAAPASRPNIVVIMADDMGYSDIGCFGSEIPTPNLDALAAGGVRFTQFYNTGRCCPTRASLTTGLYPHQAGIGHMTADQGLPGYRGTLSENAVSIAEVLRPAGYFTAMTGKWHMSSKEGSTPWTRGFDRSLSGVAGGVYFPQKNGVLFLDGKSIPHTSPELPAGWYSTDLWTDFGLRFIDEARAAKKPFFLYVAHNAPHFPLQAPEADIARFRGKYRAGWDKLAAERHQRQLASGLVDRAWKRAPRPERVQAWDSLSEAERDRFDTIMAVYAACVSHIDTAVGRLVAGLKQRGELDNTLILFFSDNGGNPEAGPNGRLEGPGAPGSAESTLFCGESWAWMQNTPLRRYKHFNDEGGISAPFIAHWPSGIKARGEFRRDPAHLIDVMATCIDLGGAKYPSSRDGKPVQSFEGVSLAPAFAGRPLGRPTPLFGEHEGNACVRDGDWKLVRVGYDAAWELYHIGRDRGEQNNLATSQPERVRTMAAQWDSWAKRANVTPHPKGNDAGSLRILGREPPAEGKAKAGKKKKKG